MLNLLYKVPMLLLGGLQLVFMSGVFTELDFHEVDLSLVWCMLLCLADPGRGFTGWGSSLVLPLPAASHAL